LIGRSITECGSPTDVFGQLHENRGELRQSLHSRIPSTVLNLRTQGVTLQVATHFNELVRRHDLVRVGRTSEHLRHEQIGVQGDWSDEAVELLRR
jgi:hypothetical protein